MRAADESRQNVGVVAAAETRRRAGAATMADLFGRCADALAVHAAMAPGRVVRLPAATPDPDEGESPDTHRSRVRHQAQAQHRAALGLSKREYRAARREGRLPGWCYAKPAQG